MELGVMLALLCVCACCGMISQLFLISSVFSGKAADSYLSVKVFRRGCLQERESCYISDILFLCAFVTRHSPPAQILLKY